MADPQSAADIIKGISDQLTGYALIVAAAGTVTMALLELLKGLIDARMRFNKWRLEKWIPDADYPAARLELFGLATGGDIEPATKRRELRGFATGEINRGDVLYDQPLEKMMGQIQAASNLALDFPQVYGDFYRFLVGARAGKELSRDAGKWREYAEAVAKGDEVPADQARFATQARARIGNLTARKLDGFQNETQYLWAELNQRVSIVSAAIFLAYVLSHLPSTSLSKPQIVVLSVFGGLIAPFAKDVVSALAGLRTKIK